MNISIVQAMIDAIDKPAIFINPSYVIEAVNDGMVSPLKRHRNVPNLELNNQVNKVRRPK